MVNCHKTQKSNECVWSLSHQSRMKSLTDRLIEITHNPSSSCSTSTDQHLVDPVAPDI